jgi:benzoyl-CoA reductase subunit C
MGMKTWDMIGKQNELALEWKSKGKKVIGYFCNYTPEEIFHAAGVLPIRILGSQNNVTHADAHIQSYVCNLIRSSLDMGLKGELGYLNGIVIPYTCDGMRFLFDLWKKSVKHEFLHLLDLPLVIKGDLGRNRFHEAIIQFKRCLEEYIGRTISKKALSNSIRVYNENRSLLRELHDLRRKANSIISSSQEYEAILSSMSWPKELHSDLLRRILIEAKRMASSFKNMTGQSKVRLHISGSLIKDLKFYDIIEECGGVVISDDLCTGTRYYWDDVEEKEDPLEAIVDRYVNKVPCPCKYPSEDRHNFLIDSLNRGDVQGVVFVFERYCDPHLYDYPILQKKVRSMNIPTLQIDSELILSGEEQLRTRIQTFISIIQEN